MLSGGIPMVKVRFVVFFAALSSLLCASALAQNPTNVTRAPEGIAILTQTAATAGWVSGSTSVQDFSASGQITYYWAHEEVQGSARVLGRGHEEFRLDSELPDASRSVAVRYGRGSLKVNNQLKKVPYQNSANFGVLTLPFPGIVAALEDLNATIEYRGLVDVQGVRLHHVLVRRNVDPQRDRDGRLSKLRTTEYFIEPLTLTLVRTRDVVRADDNVFEEYVREIQFGDYRTVAGFKVPFTVVEEFAGQRTWKLELTSVAFNTGLTDSDFQLN